MPRKGPTPASFKKGQSGNPNGRPKKEFSLTESMREYLSTKDPETKLTRREMLINSTMTHALKGDATSQKLIWNYLEGMPQQKVDLTTLGEKLNQKIEFELVDKPKEE